MSKFSLNFLLINAIIDSFFKYNIDVHDHDNSIHNDHAIRLVLHIHNLVEESWRNERQEAVIAMLDFARAKKVLDLGFSVPSRYVRQLLQKRDFKLTLCDYNLSALSFAQSLLDMWNSDWRSYINLICEDL